jgi:hypothetical protein
MPESPRPQRRDEAQAIEIIAALQRLLAQVNAAKVRFAHGAIARQPCNRGVLLLFLGDAYRNAARPFESFCRWSRGAGLRNYCFVFRVRCRYWRTVCGFGRKRENGVWKPRPSPLKGHLHTALGCALRFSATIAAAWLHTANALDALRLSSNSYSSTTLPGMGPRIARKTISALVERGCGDGSGQTDTPPDFRCFVGTATARNSTAPPAHSRDTLTIPSALAPGG